MPDMLRLRENCILSFVTLVTFVVKRTTNQAV